MKIPIVASVLLTTVPSTVVAFSTSAIEAARRSTQLLAQIRGPTEKSKELRFGWDGSTALGGAVEVAKPARMLEDIRASGETIPEECEVRKYYTIGQAFLLFSCNTHNLVL
jgi:hypothetical protein